MDYEDALKCLKKLPGAVVEGIPYSTRNVIQNLTAKGDKIWAPEKDIDDRLKKLPLQLKDALLPFQLEGVRFGLKRHGRCLIADEMGLGKTLQVSIQYERMYILLFECSGHEYCGNTCMCD